jgi:hypothetical protein
MKKIFAILSALLTGAMAIGVHFASSAAEAGVNMQ